MAMLSKVGDMVSSYVHTNRSVLLLVQYKLSINDCIHMGFAKCRVIWNRETEIVDNVEVTFTIKLGIFFLSAFSSMDYCRLLQWYQVNFGTFLLIHGQICQTSHTVRFFGNKVTITIFTELNPRFINESKAAKRTLPV